MSVSLLEVIEHSGYDLTTREDALWLICQADEFNELLEQARDILDNACELCGANPMTANCNNAACDVL